MKKLLQDIKERWQEITSPSFRYHVIFTCSECGEYMFSTTVTAKNPHHAECKALERLYLYADILVSKQCFIHVEQID